MKKLVLAALAATVSSQAMAFNLYNNEGSTLDIYGEIRLRYRSEENGIDRIDGNNTRIGIKGQYALTPETYLFGNLRMVGDWNKTDSDFSSLNPNGMTPTSAQDRLSYDRGLVGAGNTRLGEIRGGRMASTHDIMFGYDVSWAFGGIAKNGSNALGTGGETSSLVQYQWTGDNLVVIAQAQGRANDVSTFSIADTTGALTGVNAKVQNGYALGVSYKTEFGLGFSTAYTETDLTASNTVPSLRLISGVDATTYGLEVTYGIQNLELALAGFNFKQDVNERGLLAVDQSIEQDGYGASARYNMNDQLAVYAIYETLETTTSDDRNSVNLLPGGRNRKLTTTAFILGANYWPTKQFVTFAEVANIKNKDNQRINNVRTKDITNTNFALGARFYF